MPRGAGGSPRELTLSGTACQNKRSPTGDGAIVRPDSRKRLLGFRNISDLGGRYATGYRTRMRHDLGYRRDLKSEPSSPAIRATHNRCA